MKRFVFVFVALMFSGNVAADWDLVNEYGGARSYVDKATIRRSDMLSRMWTLSDYTDVQDVGKLSYLSAKNMYEFDCANELLRAVAVIQYTGQLGRGDFVWSWTDFNEKWNPVVPGTGGETLWKIGCQKK